MRDRPSLSSARRQEAGIWPIASIARLTIACGVDSALTTSSAASTIDASRFASGSRTSGGVSTMIQSKISRASSINCRMRGEVKPAIGSVMGRPAGSSASLGVICLTTMRLVGRGIQPVGQTRRRLDPKHLVHRGPAQIGVDHEHALSIRTAEGQRDVRGGERLALASDRTGDHDHLRPIRRLGVVKHRGQPPVLFPAHRRHPPVAHDLLERPLGEPLVGPVLRRIPRARRSTWSVRRSPAERSPVSGAEAPAGVRDRVRQAVGRVSRRERPHRQASRHPAPTIGFRTSTS